ncbi:MAG: hypothetical protein L0Y79_04025 [Chlorobi bacterium]|nr:hypothetical protein [Chlorobiota bacterium]
MDSGEKIYNLIKKEGYKKMNYNTFNSQINISENSNTNSASLNFNPLIFSFYGNGFISAELFDLGITEGNIEQPILDQEHTNIKNAIVGRKNPAILRHL